MGNNPSSGGKRRNSNEDAASNSRDIQILGQVQTGTSHHASKKLIIKPTQDIHEIDAISRILAEADVSDIAEKLSEASIYHGAPISGDLEFNQNEYKTIPTVFKWEGGGKDVFLSGSFNSWRAKIPMVKSKHNFYTIVELPKGDHQYKFIVDGLWKIDNKQQCMNNDNGSQNNIISVKTSDFDVLEALKDDIANSKSNIDTISNTGGAGGGGNSNNVQSPMHSPTPNLVIPTPSGAATNIDNSCANQSPPGSYGQDLPQKSMLSEVGSEKIPTPPLLPPQLLQVILNKETGVHCDPNLLPQPNHVMINHMYALSIKDGIIVLSAIARYRQKFVSTVMYKPI